jgi:hypothetical protein
MVRNRQSVRESGFCAPQVKELGTHDVHDELHEPVIAKPGPALLALPEDDHIPALADALRRAHSVAAAEDESLQGPPD